MPEDETKKKQNLKNVHVMLPAELHKRVKVMCVINSKTLTLFVEEALREKLEREEEEMRR